MLSFLVDVEKAKGADAAAPGITAVMVAVPALARSLAGIATET